MRVLSEKEMESARGGWGFLCGAAIGLAIVGAVTTGGLAIGGGMVAAEWACALDVVMAQ